MKILNFTFLFIFVINIVSSELAIDSLPKHGNLLVNSLFKSSTFGFYPKVLKEFQNTLFIQKYPDCTNQIKKEFLFPKTSINNTILLNSWHKYINSQSREDATAFLELYEKTVS